MNMLFFFLNRLKNHLMSRTENQIDVGNRETLLGKYIVLDTMK